MYYKQEQNCQQSCVPSWDLVGFARVAGWWRIGSLLYHLVTLLTDFIQPLILQRGRQEHDGDTERTNPRLSPA